MSVNIELLKDLREKSGAGMSACKDALLEAGNDLEKAMKILREKGIAQAGKKLDREAKEGICGVKIKGDKAYLLKLSCETDFVVRNEKFQHLAASVLDVASSSDVEAVKSQSLENGNKISDEISATAGVVGENIFLAKVDEVKVNSGFISTYVHSKISDNLGRIAVAIAIETNGDKSKLTEFGSQICMHIAAFNPNFLSMESISEDFIKSEREIYMKQMESSGKDPKIVEKIIDGKLQKSLQEMVLLEQVFAMDSSIKVKEFIAKAEKDFSCSISVSAFSRLAV